MLDIDVMLCQREGRIARFSGGVELLVVHSILQVPVIQQRNAPAVSVLLYEEFHVVVLGLEALSGGHGFQYRTEAVSYQVPAISYQPALAEG